MAECVRQRLAQRLRRVKRIIHSLKKGWHNTTSYRQIFSQETLRLKKKPERVVAKLSIIKKLCAINAVKASDSEQTLRHLNFHPLGFSEQDDCGAK